MTALAASSESADVHSSSEEYARRFSGPVGKWFLDVQDRALIECVRLLRARGIPCRSVLDVGGGHAQVAGALLEEGLDVTVLGSDARCSERLAERSAELAPGARIPRGRIDFAVGDLVDPPFEEKSFDLVTCFRIVSHCERWPDLLANLARCARHAVVIDYPTLRSLNVGTPMLFGVKRKIEGNTRHYELFNDRDVDAVFKGCGFDTLARIPQFLCPMGLHRAMKNVSISKTLEGVASAFRLTTAFGSPVVGGWVRR